MEASRKTAAQPYTSAIKATGGKAYPAVPVLQRQSGEQDEPQPMQMKTGDEQQPATVAITSFVVPAGAKTDNPTKGITGFDPVQKKPNDTGLPDNLKSGLENLSGFSMNDVRVHYNSDKPAQLQAHAYAQGADIHLAPGQERHLPHEGWHVVQQKQGRVQPTVQMKGNVPVNDDKGLESEADVMGARALQISSPVATPGSQENAPDSQPIIQAKGFKRVNARLPAELEEGSPEKVIVKAGSDVWDAVFTDDTIDREGGIIATYTASGAEIDADATTIHEEGIPLGAFAVMTVKGDVTKGTTIDRWASKEVRSEASSELVFDPALVTREEILVKAVITAALEGGKADDEAEPDKMKLTTLRDFALMMKPIADWCAENPDRKNEVVNFIYTQLHLTMTERAGRFSKGFCETISGDDEDAFPGKLFSGLVSTFALKGVPENRVVSTPAPLSLNEIIMHEFGHIRAGLITSPESVVTAKSKFGANLESATTLAGDLLVMLKGGPPDRAALGALRFGWSRIVSDWHRTDTRGMEPTLIPKTRDAIKIMQNILVSIEEYLNIMDIDNYKAPASALGMRLKHGTELIAGGQLGIDLIGIEGSLANRGRTKEAPARQMADDVWRAKLTILLQTFLGKYKT